MKKRLISIVALLVALMLVVLTGCETKVERKDKEEKTTAAETTEKADEGNNDAASGEESGEDTTLTPDASEDGADKPSKPVSGNSTITNSEDFFENTDVNDSVSQDYVEDAIEKVDESDEDLEEIIKSGEFVVAMREIAQDGTVSVMRIARKGDNIALFADSPEEKMGVIVTADIIYMVFADEEAYFALPTELLGEDIEELTSSFDEGFDFDSESDEAVKTYTETIDGVEYRVEEDEDGRKSYYIGNRPVMGELEDGSMMYMDSFSGDVPDSIFEVPSGYRQMTMEEFQQMATA